MCDKCTAANAEVKKIINEVGAKKLVGMLDSITGHGDAHPLDGIRGGFVGRFWHWVLRK